MSVLLYRRLVRIHLLPTPLLRALATTAASTLSRPPPLSSSPSSSFTVDFLTTSCGLTPGQALRAARTLRFDEKTRQKPESVLSLLRSYGFSDAQVAELVVRSPRVLLCRAQEKLDPKLRFLTKAGFSSAMISRVPGILLRSVDRHIRPCFEFFRRLATAEDVCTVFRRHRWCLNYSIKKTMIPNVGLLLELGVAAPAISRLMITYPRCLMKNHERFAEKVQIVQDWGLKPENNLFPHAVRAVCGMSKSTLAAKLELFKNLGWSEDEVMSAFRRCPLCILVSEQKLRRMNSFARKVDLGPSHLSRRPTLLTFSFDKRILPRYVVWQVLTSKGLIEHGTDKLVSMFTKSEMLFLGSYVRRYMDKVPELMDVYLGKIKVEGFDLGGEECRSKQML